MVTSPSGAGSGFALLIYKAVRDPSRHRVAVWRRLKAAGALYLQDSVCALPDDEGHRRFLAGLAHDIRRNGGDGVVLVAQGFDEATEQAVVARFNAERDADYTEILDQCAALLAEIEREQAKGNFGFAALEDTEGNLERLRRWTDTVVTRDFFAAGSRSGAEALLARCVDTFDAFAAAVVDNSEIEAD